MGRRPRATAPKARIGLSRAVIACPLRSARSIVVPIYNQKHYKSFSFYSGSYPKILQLCSLAELLSLVLVVVWLVVQLWICTTMYETDDVLEDYLPHLVRAEEPLVWPVLVVPPEVFEDAPVQSPIPVRMGFQCRRESRGSSPVERNA